MKVDARLLWSARILVVLVVGVLALRLAWMSDDSLITLRTALNITHEWGPGFNATERVQAFTHPLWFLLWVALGVTTNQWVVGLLLLSVLLTMGAVLLLVCQAASLARVLGAGLLLVLSNAFMEFSTSGLENPLAYLLVGLLFAISVRRWGVGPAAAAGLTVAAVVLTRFDLVLIVAPVVALLLWRSRRRWQLLAALLVTMIVPVVAWLTWSKITYDAWLPNTFEAKRNVQIPQGELIVEGLRYLWVTFENDPVSFLVLVGATLLGTLFGPWPNRAWVAGAALYLAYVVWIGGDFMAGRFVAVPVFICVFVLVRLPAAVSKEILTVRPPGTAVLLVSTVGILLLTVSAGMGAAPTSLTATTQPRWEVEQNTNAGVTDERGFTAARGMTLAHWAQNLSLAFVNPDIAPLGDSSGLARTLREVDKAAANWPVSDGAFTLPSEVGVYCGFLGDLGIATGPITHLIDGCALTDRFLASRPFVPAEPFAWKPGHFHRDIPEGYVEAVVTDDPSRVTDREVQSELRDLWDRIR